MILYFIKKDALDLLKGSLDSLYKYYYLDDSNQWIYEFMQENGISEPFQKFREVRDFELSSLDNPNKGEIDLNNCKIIYKNLAFLTPSQASDERLWVGLGHTVFYQYLRRRSNYVIDRIAIDKNPVGSIKTRFFFSGGGGRGGIYRNSLAQCWWVGMSTYSPMESENKFYKLDVIGASDISSKISDIFRNNKFASNPEILNGIIDALMYFKDRKIELRVKNHIRPAMQSLNALGGSLILDCMGRTEIAKHVIMCINNILQGKGMEIQFDEENEIDDEIAVTEEGEIEIKESDKLKPVTYGDTVVLKDNRTNMIKKFKVRRDIKKSYILLEKTIGEEVVIDNSSYTVDAII